MTIADAASLPFVPMKAPIGKTVQARWTPCGSSYAAQPCPYREQMQDTWHGAADTDAAEDKLAAFKTWKAKR